MYHFAPSYFFDAFAPILSCLKTTMLVTFASFAAAFILAIVLSVIGMCKNRVVQVIMKVWLSLFRGTPLLCQLFLFCYGIFPYTPGIQNLSLTTQAILCLALSYSAFMAETIRGAILSVDKGQMEAGRSLGMSYVTTMKDIILPQAMKSALPALINEMITLLKETSICGYIGLNELTRGGDIIRGITFDALFPLFTVALIYLVMVLFIQWIMGKVERRLRSSDYR